MQLLSRHRLISPYRYLLAGLWLAPLFVLLLLLIANGALLALVRPPLWAMLALMIVPAWHVWQQGVDVRAGGLTVRIYVPRFTPYHAIRSWQLKTCPQGRVLTIYDRDGAKLLSFHTAHLTDLPALLTALDDRVQWHDYVRR